MPTFARVIVVALLATGTARAEDACRADVETLCAGIPKGGGRISACLKANQAKLSPECKAQLASVAGMVKQLGEACSDDVSSLCAGVQRGGGAVVRCLSENFYSVTPECQQVVRAAREKSAEFQKTCKGDARKLCKGIRQGQGRVLACLKSKEAELTPECKALVAGEFPPAR